MIEYFGNLEGKPYRAVQAWQILVGAAYHRQTLTYEDMSELMDYGIARNVVNALDPIFRYCENNDLPPLTALVVGMHSGIPGESFVEEYPNIPKAQADVYARDWYAIRPPTPEQFAELL